MGRRIAIPILFLGMMLWVGELGTSLSPAAQASSPESSAQSPAALPEVIKTESEMVLVDVIATDKKDRHITDLTAKDFKVYDDNKEQTIASFNHLTATQGADTAHDRRYIVLFFDNSTMNPSDQTIARKAAADFVSAAASKDREFAVIDFIGVPRIAQNFTSDPNALRAAVEGLKFGTLKPEDAGTPNEEASLAGPSAAQIRSDFGARTILLAIRSTCLSLRSVPGRKTLILFSGGFPLNIERETELSATIDSANKANVAIYPVDVRGLEGLAPPTMNSPENIPQGLGGPPGASLRDSIFPHEPELLAALGDWIPLSVRLNQRGGQVGGGGGGGGGPRGGGGAAGGGGAGGGSFGGAGGGTRGGGPTGSPGGPAGSPGGAAGSRGGAGSFGGGTRGGGYNPNASLSPNFRNTPAGQIIPPLMANVSINQQILYALAEGTGGFVIANTNDFKTGLERIGRDMDDYYIIGYVPPNPAHDGSYHRIKVKVERHGVEIRARNGYFDVKSPDLLAGKPEGKVLEERSASAAPSDYPVSVSAPFFYTSPGVARVDLSIEAPARSIEYDKEKGKYHSEINVLGIAYRPDGSVGARFSDTVKNEVDKKELKELEKAPFTYQNNFDIAPGNYKLKIVMSASGEKFGKFEEPLSIDPFTGKEFGISDIVLSHEMHPASQLVASLDTALLEERTPLLFKGMEIIPTAGHRFTKQEKMTLYCETYEPQPIVNGSPRVGIIVDIFDSKTNNRVFTSNTIPVNEYAVESNPLIPVAVNVPLDSLAPGTYRLQVRALDSLGDKSPMRTENFTLQ